MKTGRQLDRETQSRYHLVAHVQDHYRSWECSSQIEIIISDENDNSPMFSLPIYTVSLPEDAEIGTLVTKVHATDIDIGINRRINYTFIDSFNEHFQIIPDSGIITLAKPMDREEKDMYNLTVQAFDHGDPRLSSMAYVIVNVQVKRKEFHLIFSHVINQITNANHGNFLTNRISTTTRRNGHQNTMQRVSLKIVKLDPK